MIAQPQEVAVRVIFIHKLMVELGRLDIIMNERTVIILGGTRVATYAVILAFSTTLA